MFLGRVTDKAIFLAISFQRTSRTIASNTDVDFVLCVKGLIPIKLVKIPYHG